jgi:hypothetical protein
MRASERESDMLPALHLSLRRGFLQQRQAQLQLAGPGATAGESWLFFGCRHPEQDYLYQQDLEVGCWMVGVSCHYMGPACWALPCSTG